MGELVYKDVIPSLGGDSFFYARIIGVNHVGAELGGVNRDVVYEQSLHNRQAHNVYAWEEVIPTTKGNIIEWQRGSRSSYGYYDDRTGATSGSIGYDMTSIGDSIIDTDDAYQYYNNSSREEQESESNSHLIDRSLYREFVPDGIGDYDYDVSGASGGESGGVGSGGESGDVYAGNRTLSPFEGSLAINISEHNRTSYPASPVGTIVLMQDYPVGDSGVYRYYFNSAETRPYVLAKITRAHPIGLTMPNVSEDEDPEFRMWAYEWCEVDWNFLPDLSSMVARQHIENDDLTHYTDEVSSDGNGGSVPLTPEEMDNETRVTGMDYPIRNSRNYRVDGKVINENPRIEVGGFTANADIDHWVHSRLGTGDAPWGATGGDVFDLVLEKGLFKDVIVDKAVKYDNYMNEKFKNAGEMNRYKHRLNFLQNELTILKGNVFIPIGKEDDAPMLTYNVTGASGASGDDMEFPEIDVDEIKEYLDYIDLPRSNPLAINTCEIFNVSSDNEFVDVGIRSDEGYVRTLPRYVSPGVDMSKLPRFMRVQPIRPGSIVIMHFPSTSLYSESNIRYSPIHSHSGVPIPLQNRPGSTPPMFTCPNAIDTLDDPCAYKQLPFPFKLEQVNEEFTSTIQPVQGAHIVSNIPPNHGIT